MYQTMYIHSLCLACFLLISRSLSFPLRANVEDIAALINKFPGTSITITRPVQIYSKNSRLHIRVVNGSKLDGRAENGDASAKMMLESVNIKGYIRIRSIEENSYICVSARGLTIVIEPKGNTIDRCVFVEDFHNGYTMFRSVYNFNWYLGVQRSGSAKAPWRTAQKQKAAQFLIRPVS